jgi:ketosteroid isomerase-like protein
MRFVLACFIARVNCASAPIIMSCTGYIHHLRRRGPTRTIDHSPNLVEYKPRCPMRVTALVGIPALVLLACTKTPQNNVSESTRANEAESPLPMEDSARAHLRRVDEAIRKGDSAAYMSAYAKDVVLVSNGEILNESRDQYAKRVGPQISAGGIKDATFSNEKITVVGPRSVAASIDYTLTGDSAGKTVTTHGAWTGVLGIRDGKTVILQQHLSLKRPAKP